MLTVILAKAIENINHNNNNNKFNQLSKVKIKKQLIYNYLSK